MNTLIVLLCVAAPAAYGSVQVQSSTCPLFQELAPAAEEWRQAVVSKDSTKLSAFAVIDDRAQVAADLGDRSSTLWWTLFGPRDAVGSMLSDRRTRVAVFKRPVDGTRDYATTCYYKGVRRAWPDTYVGLMKLSDQKRVFCLDWLRDDDGKWYMSYGFGYEDDDPDRK